MVVYFNFQNAWQRLSALHRNTLLIRWKALEMFSPLWSLRLAFAWIFTGFPLDTLWISFLLQNLNQKVFTFGNPPLDAFAQAHLKDKQPFLSYLQVDKRSVRSLKSSRSLRIKRNWNSDTLWFSALLRTHFPNCESIFCLFSDYSDYSTIFGFLDGDLLSSLFKRWTLRSSSIYNNFVWQVLLRKSIRLLVSCRSSPVPYQWVFAVSQ